MRNQPALQQASIIYDSAGLKLNMYWSGDVF